MIKNILSIIVCLTFMGHTALCQKSINSNDFLASVISNLQNAPSSPLLQVSDNQYLREKFIDEVQFRTEMDEWDFDRQRYTLRVKPANRKIQRYERALYKTKVSQLKIDAALNIEDQVKDAYEDWIEYVLNAQEMTLHNDLQTIQKDRLKVLERNLVLPKFDAVDLLEEEEDYHSTEMNIQELASEQNISKLNIENYLAINQKLPTDADLISIKQIKTLIGQLNNYDEKNHPDFAKLEARQKLILAEAELEEAEKRSYFDFAQIEYRGPHEELLRERVSLGVGFRFTTKSNTIKMNELQLEAMEEQFEFQQDVQERIVRADAAKKEIYELLVQYDLLLEQSETSKYSHQKIATRYARSAETSPLLLLKIKELEQKKAIREIRLKKDIYEAYIDWLFWTGKMMQQPFVNYLANDLSLVKN